ELKQMRLAELERIRLERLRQIEEAAGKYNGAVSQCEALRMTVVKSVLNESGAFNHVAELKFACKSFQELGAVLESEISALTAVKLPAEADEITALSEKMKKRLGQLEAQLNDGLSNLKKRLEVYNEGQSALADSKDFSRSISAIEKVQSIKFSDVGFDISVLFDTNIDVEISFDDHGGTDFVVEEVLAECTALANLSGTGKQLRSQLLDIIGQLQASGDKVSAQIAAVSQYRTLRGTALKSARHFNDLYVHYCALHSQWRGLNTGNKKISELPLRTKQEFDSAKNIKEEIQQLDEKIKANIKRTYIREQIDEVMNQFGYNTAQSIVFAESTKGESFLFESDTKAVHMFISDSNRIMFEPVGLDNLHADNSNKNFDAQTAEKISDSDRSAIYQDQVEFCTLHPKILKELERRGVIFNGTQRKEASKDIAKMIKVKGKASKYNINEENQRHRFEDKKLKEAKFN
ncbi:MAG: hypothetical protein FWB75_01750, partial [Oscillospiraceae bacterium]|nr:hypothetical protein [Oscillospiraceae bacterium]